MRAATHRRVTGRALKRSCLLIVILAFGIALSPRAVSADDPTVESPTLAELGLPTIAAIASEGGQSCLIGHDGTVWCWGSNQFGQLGIGGVPGEWLTKPRRVEGLPDRVREVVTTNLSTCAITERGGLWCWGRNTSGELGDGTREDRAAPVAVIGLDARVATISQAGTTGHMCAVLDDGSAKCWGDNYAGQLGDGTSEERSGPVRVTVTDEKLVAMVASIGRTCALTAGGAVRCWGMLWDDGEVSGRTEVGAVADPAVVTPLGLGSGVVSLSGSDDSVCALRDDSEIRCWSWGRRDPALTASAPWNPGLVPETVPGLPDGLEAVELVRYDWAVEGSGATETSIWACATRGDQAWCWGDNHHGQLGDGTTTDRAAPVQVETGGIAQLALRHGASLALLTDGSLVTWGDLNPAPRSPFAGTTQPASTGFREPDTLVPAITTHIPTPADISTDPPVVGANLLLAALAMIVFTIATELLNRSLGQLDPALARRFRPLGLIDRTRAQLDAALPGRLAGSGHARLANGLRIVGIVAFYGVAFALLDPTWDPLSITGLWLVFIMAVAFGLIGLSGDLAAWATARRWGVASDLAVKPGSLVAAIGSTLFSRVFVLVPGVMIGSPEALDIDAGHVDRRKLGGIAGAGLGTILGVGLIAWIATLGTTALRGNGDLLDVGLGGIEAFLLLVFAAAVQNGFVQLLSLRESAGLALRRTHRVVWAIGLAVVTFAFWHTLVNPRGDLAEALGATNVVAFLATIGVVLAVTVVVWLVTFFARRRAAGTPSTKLPPVPPTPSTPGAGAAP